MRVCRFAILLPLLVTGCSMNGTGVAGPSTADIQACINEQPGRSAMCQSNMVTIAGGCVIFFASHNRYPYSIQELGDAYAGLSCTNCDGPYIYIAYDEGPGEPAFFICCPSFCDPCHGHIRNGMASWLRE